LLVGPIGPAPGRPSLPVKADVLDQPIHGILYSLDIELFNEKEINTGLLNLSVVFLDESGSIVTSCPVMQRYDPAENGNAFQEPFERVPLRSGEFKVLHLDTILEVRHDHIEEDKEMISRYRAAEFHGRFPAGREFCCPIAFPASFEVF